MAKKINIIGAGIAGLSAGCYLQMNGYDTEIFELHDLPGGLCTSWDRMDYTIDGCIHWLVGSRKNDEFYNLWNELIDMSKIRFVDFDEYFRIEGDDGAYISVFTDLDKLEKEFLTKAPEDREFIYEFINAARKLSHFKIPINKAPETYNLFDIIKLLYQSMPYLRNLIKWSKISCQEYAKKCQNKLLQKTIDSLFMPEMSVLFVLMTLIWMDKKSAGYPIGGSLKWSKLIEQKYLSLGGKINYNSKVSTILHENSSTKGIKLENGKNYYSDIVVSAADGYDTIFRMLEGQFLDEKIKDYYSNYETFPSYLQVSFGVRQTFNDSPHLLYFPLSTPLILDESTQEDYMGFRIFNFDPTLAPAGKTLITAILPTYNHTYWEDLRKNNFSQYKLEKDRIAQEVIEIFRQKFDCPIDKVDMIDVSTPATVIRYTNNWKGSFEGWILTPKIGLKQMKKTLPGLKNFYMAGQWVEPGGGLPAVLMSGRNVTQIICKQDKKRFVSQIL